MRALALRTTLIICMVTGMALPTLADQAPAIDNCTDNSTGRPAAIAGDPPPETPRRFERFGRGVINVLSPPLEMPAHIYVHAVYQQNKTNDVFQTLGGFVEGVPMGIIRFPWRLAAGVYDLCTFPLARCNKCIIKPDYVSFSPESVDKM